MSRMQMGLEGSLKAPENMKLQEEFTMNQPRKVYRIAQLKMNLKM